MKHIISKKDLNVQGEITLDGSKSISNRILLIQALCKEDFKIENLSTSKDTTTLVKILDTFNKAEDNEVITLDTGAAGTTFRFMTAFLSMQKGTQILTGSARMKQRPIGVLVEALKKLGANIEYLEKEGYPPLKIGAPNTEDASNNELSIEATVSSQYISALLMLAPTLPKGLRLTLEGDIVSRSYIEMTLGMMKHFGVEHQWDNQTIIIQPQSYQAKYTIVEADWSAASYYYIIAAFAEKLDLQLNGLSKESFQGDAVIADMMTKFGIQTSFNKTGIKLLKSGERKAPMFEWDFILCPDIAQSLAVACGGLGVQGLFSGLSTLQIKETDRILALQQELQKIQVFFSKLPERFTKKKDQDFYMIEGKVMMQETPSFDTYEDHRMAMAFAPLSMFHEIEIKEPMVVEKSYPAFWEDLKTIGFEVN